MVREAELIDSKYFICASLEDDASCLANFLVQYYSDTAFIPQEIVLPFDLEDANVISQLLSDRAARKITLRSAKRGEKQNSQSIRIRNQYSQIFHGSYSGFLIVLSSGGHGGLSSGRLTVAISSSFW